MKKKMIIIILGIIFAIVIGGAMYKSSYDNKLEAKAKLEREIEQLSNEIEVIETYVANNDEQIWQYCVDRWAYYDTLEGEYSADEHTDDVFNDGATQFGISAGEVQATWDKVDKVKTGISN